MLATTWHLLLAAAFVVSYVGLSRRVDARLGGLVATVLWALVAIGAFEHRTIVSDGEGGTAEAVTAAPEVGLFAATLTLVMAAFTFAAMTGQLPEVKQTRWSQVKNS